MVKQTLALIVISALSMWSLAASAQTGTSVVAQASKPECFCTDRQGKRRELGEVICLTVDRRSFRAKCVMAQNNPFWRDLNEGCLSS